MIFYVLLSQEYKQPCCQENSLRSVFTVLIGVKCSKFSCSLGGTTSPFDEPPLTREGESPFQTPNIGIYIEWDLLVYTLKLSIMGISSLFEYINSYILKNPSG